MARMAAAVKSTTEPRAKRVRFATVAECKATRPGVPSLRLAPRTYLQCDARGNKSGILVYTSPLRRAPLAWVGFAWRGWVARDDSREGGRSKSSGRRRPPSDRRESPYRGSWARGEGRGQPSGKPNGARQSERTRKPCTRRCNPASATRSTVRNGSRPSSAARTRRESALARRDCRTR